MKVETELLDRLGDTTASKSTTLTLASPPMSFIGPHHSAHVMRRGAPRRHRGVYRGATLTRIRTLPSIVSIDAKEGIIPEQGAVGMNPTSYRYYWRTNDHVETAVDSYIPLD